MATQFPAEFTPTAASHVSYEALKSVIQARAGQPMAPYIVNIPNACSVMFTCAGNSEPHLDAIARETPNVDVARLRAFPTYIHALSHTHARYLVKSKQSTIAEERIKRGIEQRRILNAERELLVARGLIPQDAVELAGTVGALAVATDIRALCATFNTYWEQAKIVVGTKQRLDDSIVIADAIDEAVASAKEVQEEKVDAEKERNAAWHLAYDIYRELYRSIQFLRFHDGDVDVLVPSVFDTVKSRKSDGNRPEANGPANGLAEGSAASAAATRSALAQAQLEANIPASPIAPTTRFDE